MGSFRIGQTKSVNNIRPLQIGRAVPNIASLTDHRALGNHEKGLSALGNLNDLIRKIPVASLKKLEPHTKKVSFAAGEFLYRPDEQIDWLYFPETAVISELQILEDGRTIEVSITGHEGAVGIPSIYFPGRAANWVQVCGPGMALKIKRDAFRKETRNLEWVNLLLQEYIQSYIRQISQKVACNAHHSVEERFCTWLLMLQDRSPRGRLKLTQEHVARVLGVYRPSVTCIAQQLRDSALIDYVRGNIVILDREKLKERSCGCYAELSSSPALSVKAYDGYPKQNKQLAI
jgi:CRP-like cAMP-binding protein